jgi:hypothetical protein
MNIKKIFSPYYILIFFIIFILIFISVNFLGNRIFQFDEYFYEKIRKTFNLFCFLPGIVVFIGISIWNFSISKSNNDKKNMRVSLVPITLIGLFCLYIFLMLLYAAFIRDIGVN